MPSNLFSQWRNVKLQSHTTKPVLFLYLLDISFSALCVPHYVSGCSDSPTVCPHHLMFCLTFHRRTCGCCVCLFGRQDAAEKLVFRRNQRCLLKEMWLCLTLPKKRKEKKTYCSCSCSNYLATNATHVFILSFYVLCCPLVNSVKSTLNQTISSQKL